MKPKTSACFVATIAIITALALLPGSTSQSPWQIYTPHDNSFSRLPAHLSPLPPAPPSPCPLSPLPPTWHVTASLLADVTGDDVPECVLLVWRPWQDWYIQRWLSVPSPIAGFHDAAGDSCHLILLDPDTGRETWAGSALPVPLLTLAVGDVDGDGRNEIVTLEGTYATGRDGPASHVNVWRWNGFGFALEHRSPPGAFHQLYLTDVNNDGILNIVVR